MTDLTLMVDISISWSISYQWWGPIPMVDPYQWRIPYLSWTAYKFLHNANLLCVFWRITCKGNIRFGTYVP